MGLIARLSNVLAAPSDVFDHVRQAPVRHANWLVPVALFVLLGWVAAAVLLSQDWSKQQMLEAQLKGLHQQVEKGKMTEDQFKQASAGMEKMSGVITAGILYGAPLMVGVISPFFWALVLWLIGTKMLGGQFGFSKALEAACLPYVIGALGTVVETLVRLVTGNLAAGLSPVLLVRDFDLTNPLHSLLPVLSLFSLWELAVRSVALSRLTLRPFGTAALVVFGAWVFVYGGQAGIGFIFRAAFGG
jgi:hypothetical protein